MNRGYIKIWRKIQDSFLWQNPKALILFTHLLMEANYKETEFMMNYKKIFLKRGQLICGRKQLSFDTGIGEGTIYKLMEMFEHEHLIEQQKTNLYTIVTMVNYNKYQDFEQQNEQQVVQQTVQQAVQPSNTSKELIRTNKNIYTSSFESVWSKYPKKLGKNGAIRSFNATVKTEDDVIAINKALTNFLGSRIAKGDPQYIPHGATWFNNWRDWVDYKDTHEKKERTL